MKQVVAIVGMPGAGKGMAAKFFAEQKIPVIRFGDLTEEVIQERGLALNPENERVVREDLRREYGMEAYAVKAWPKIQKALEDNQIVAIDGLYSWEEFLYLRKQISNLILLSIFASPKIRYERLAKREVRPLKPEEASARDFAEIENLNKGGPIAMADYLIKNESDVDKLDEELGIFLDILKTTVRNEPH